MLYLEVNGKLRDQNADRITDSEDCAHEAPDGNEGSIGSWTRCYLCTFWQRTCLHFVRALRLCVRLDFKVMD
jgi:hypothetical protein